MKKNNRISAAPKSLSLDFEDWTKICLRVLEYEVKTSPQYSLSLLKLGHNSYQLSRISEKRAAFRKGVKALKMLKSLRLELTTSSLVNRVILEIKQELELIDREFHLVPKGRPSRSIKLQMILYFGTLRFDRLDLVRFFDATYNKRIMSLERNKAGSKVRDLGFLMIFLTSRRHPITNSPNNQAFQIKELRRSLKKSVQVKYKTKTAVSRAFEEVIAWGIHLKSMTDHEFSAEIAKSPSYQLRVRKKSAATAKRFSPID
ncbi:MAG: hypothetical protein EB120_05025 [Proteobacteria bacterium]|nr:hypothetical protein [Pseudomonadota bacterium]NDG26521.1 hypothetical protein [Pseudomonadota bacterium]